MLQINEKEIAVVTLGTGCAAPTLKRRLPSTAIIHDGSVFLFDAGEGTQIQYRKPRLRFNRLSNLFISHLHGDHVTGIIGMLMSMELQNRTEPLHIIGPPGIEEFIETNRRMLNTFFSFSITIQETVGETIHIDKQHIVTAKPLDHRVFCLGYRFEEKKRPGEFFPDKAEKLNIPQGPLWGQLKSGKTVTLPDGRAIQSSQVTAPSLPGRKIAYCTDTRPCDAVLELAENADVLIYDGTFAAGEEEKAYHRGHSSAKDAFELGQKAGVKTVILTHISARYTALKELTHSMKFNPPPKLFAARDVDTYILPWQGNLKKRKRDRYDDTKDPQSE